MTWQLTGRAVEPAFLGALAPERVLFEYEGPRTFIARDAAGDLLFAHQCGETEDYWRYAVVPFSDALLGELEAGRLDLWSALDQPRLWIVDLAPAGKIANCIRYTLSEIPETCRPKPGVMVYPELDPLLSVRSIGSGVELGAATIGLLRNALENVRNALKTLAEYARGNSPKKSKTKAYYDLPVVLVPGSVRVSVLPPPDRQGHLFDFDDVWQRMEAVLNRGLNEVQGEQSEASELNSNDELQIAIQAAYWLAPPAYGPVERTEISGRLVAQAGKPITITRQARSALRQRLENVSSKQPDIIRDEGYITELDKDELTCMLRDAASVTLRVVSFDETLYDQVAAAFDSGRRVQIVAREAPSLRAVELLALEPIRETPDNGEKEKSKLS